MSRRMEHMEQQLDCLAEKFKGQAVVSVKETTLKKVEEEWKWTLSVKLSTRDAFNVQGLVTVPKRVWRMSRGVRFVRIPGAMAMVKFESGEMLNKVLEGGPWTFSGAAVLFKKWEVGSLPQSLSFDKLQIWVQIHNLPFELVMEDTAVEVAKVAGVVCREMKYDGEVTIRRFIRFQVEIDIRDQVKAGCFSARRGKVTVWVYFNYERLLECCQRCGALNHDSDGCEFEVREGVGPWLKAENLEVWDPARPCGDRAREGDEEQVKCREGPLDTIKRLGSSATGGMHSEECPRKESGCRVDNVRHGTENCRLCQKEDWCG